MDTDDVAAVAPEALHLELVSAAAAAGARIVVEHDRLVVRPRVGHELRETTVRVEQHSLRLGTALLVDGVLMAETCGAGRMRIRYRAPRTSP